MLKVGDVLHTADKVRKPKTVHEHLLADDDGLIHDGSAFTVSSALTTSDSDTSDLFMCGPDTVAKIVKRPGDNDLRENEAEVLRKLNAKIPSDASTFRHYIPKLRGSVKHDGRVCNLISFADGCVSLAAVLRAYPNGIDFRDMVWMLKRLLIGIGFVHEQGYVHGSIIPAHVLVHPEKHGALLVGWSSATPPERRVTLMSRTAAAFYAPEIPARTTVAPATDIYMTFKIAVALLGGNLATNQLPDSVPEPIRAFFVEPLEQWIGNRPTSAWNLHDDLNKLLLDVVGKPTYRPFHMPTGTP